MLRALGSAIATIITIAKQDCPLMPRLMIVRMLSLFFILLIFLACNDCAATIHPF